MRQNISEKKIEKKKYEMLAVFLIALLPRLLFLAEVYPLSVTGDETFTLMPAAAWAGLDWSGNAGAYRYYGYGFVALLTPLFKLIENPVVLYRVLVAFMIFFQALAAPVSYHIIKRYFRMKDRRAAMLLSVVCSYLVFLRAVYVYNEFIYDTVVWLIFWCLLELADSCDRKKRKAVLTGILAVLLTYAMTIHSRAVTLWLALAVTVILFFWIYRKWLISIPVFAVFGSAGYFLYNQGMEHIVRMFTSAVSSSEVGNTHVSFSIAALFYSAKAGMAWLYIVLGQINTMVIVTGGAAMLAAVIGCRFLWNGLFRKKEIINKREETQNYVTVFAYGLAASAITIIGQAFSWLPGVIETIETCQATDGMRAVTYLRYYGIYFVPVLMAGFVWIYQNRERLKEIFIPSMVCTIGLQGFWVIFIVPYIADFVGTSWESNPFSFTKGWEDSIRIRTYLPAVLFSVALLFSIGMLIKKNRYNAGMLLLAAVLFYTYGFNCIYHEGERGKINYSYAEKSFKVMQRMEEQAAAPDEVYVEDLYIPVTGQSLVSECQFLFKNKKIVPKVPKKTMENVIFITYDSRENRKLLENGFLRACLDENEYWYVKGDALKKAAKQAGLEWEKPAQKYGK